MIQIDSGSWNLEKLGEWSSPFRQAGFIGREVAGDDVRRAECWQQGAEFLATAQIGRRVELGRLAEKRIPARGKLSLWSSVVAVITSRHILRLRQKLERDIAKPVHFRTVHGMGYKFVR